MPLKLMYITNDPEVAIIAENAGVDRIFVDLETLGKEERQSGLNSVKSKHTFGDVSSVKAVLKKAELLVRVNPPNVNSEDEIDKAIENGADVVMLPMFKDAGQAQNFIESVTGRAKACLLVENKFAVEDIDNILKLQGIDEIFIGLNDLNISYGGKFMFEMLSGGPVEALTVKFGERGLKYGFGGIARLGCGLIPAEYILAEHYRLGSSMAILSRSFCNYEAYEDKNEIKAIFDGELRKIRRYERELEDRDETFFARNKIELANKISAMRTV